MQIFFTDESPYKAAKYLYVHDLRRANKQITEGIQLFNNCCITVKRDRLRPMTKNKLFYKKRNFPKIFENWLLSNVENMMWFYSFIDGLSVYFPEHKAIRPYPEYNNMTGFKGLIEFQYRRQRKEKELEPFPNYAKSKAKGLDFTHIKSTETAYKKYLDAQLKYAQ